jgi:colanic acid/amylovoran biosynthesis glycosyltransferase
VIAENGDSEGGAPVSIIEASASGMMVVSTLHCDIPEVIEHGISGLLAPEHSPEQLAEHLLTFARNPERWARMAQAGRKRIEMYYDLKQQIASLEDIYRRTLEND